MLSRLKISVLIGLVFFVLGVLTLPHYGINWDTINHLPRGQVYLHYFLTGNKDYSNLPSYFKEWQAQGQWYWQMEDSLLFDPDVPKGDVPRLSLYQSAGVDFDYFMQRDGGHPPLSDILSSAFNYILFQKLGLINDIDSYRIYGVLLASSLVGLVYWWTSKIYGGIAGLIAAISLAMYPLFWSESHFNTEKDIPETTYWSFFLFSLWKGVGQKSWKWMLSSGVFFGLALGTKFNIIFVGFVAVPWLLLTNPKIVKEKWFIASSVLALAIGLGLFVGLWPFLWADPIANLQVVTDFYRGIGLTTSLDSRFSGPFGINTYPILWIIFSTPLAILALGFVGLLRGFKDITKDKTGFVLIVFLWLIVPVARVTWPGTTVYGGARQFMEYIPALAILSGIGGAVVFGWLSGKTSRPLAFLLLLTPFVLFAYNLYKIHPNENVYFNPIVGGLSGAKERDFPFWGNSFGAAYRQGVGWLNENAEEGADVAYAYELIPNIPRIWLRTDLNLHNTNRSGYQRNGEYVITLTYDGTDARSYYDMYLSKFVEPVYEAKVDGVSVLTIWKNDDEHLKLSVDEAEDVAAELVIDTDRLRFDLGEIRKLSRLEISYSENGCVDLESGHIRISENGENWEMIPGVLPNAWRIATAGKQPSNGSFTEPFVGQEARYIDFVVSPAESCILKNISDYKLFYLK